MHSPTTSELKIYIRSLFCLSYRVFGGWRGNLFNKNPFLNNIYFLFICQGEGQFGDVHRGIYKTKSGEIHNIAVKTCKVSLGR